MVHVADEAAKPIPSNAAKLGGARSTLIVPILKDDQLIGTIVIYRQEVRPFTDKQIELLITPPPRPPLPSKIRGYSKPNLEPRRPALAEAPLS